MATTPTPRKRKITKKTTPISKTRVNRKPKNRPAPHPLSPPLDKDLKKIRLVKELNGEEIGMLRNLESHCGEYLDDFILLGHAINGSRVSITHAHTPRDLDALEQFYTDSLIMLKSKKSKEQD